MAQRPARRGRPSRASIHERLEFEVGQLKACLGGLPLPAEAEDIWTTIWYQEAHNSTALEGNTLVLREVEALLGEGRRSPASCPNGRRHVAEQPSVGDCIQEQPLQLA
jgi:hypothetical protein